MGFIGDAFKGITNAVGQGLHEVFGRPGDLINNPAKFIGDAAMGAAPFLGGPLAGALGTAGAIPGWASGLMSAGGGMLAGQHGGSPFSPYLPFMAGMLGNQFGAPFGTKFYKGGPYPDNGMGDNALNYANLLGNAGISQLQQGMNGLPGLGQMGALGGMPNIMNMEAQLSGLPLDFSGLMNSQGSPYQLNTQPPGSMTPGTGAVAGAPNRGVGTGVMVGGSPPIAGQMPPWGAGYGITPTNDQMNNYNFNAYNQGLQTGQPSQPPAAAGTGSTMSEGGPQGGIGNMQAPPIGRATGNPSPGLPSGSPVTQTGALNPNQLPQFMQEQYNRIADDSAQGFQASKANLQQQFAANGITDPRAIAAAEAQLSAGHSKLLADTHASLMGQNMQNQQNQLNQFGNQLGSLYGAQYGQQQGALGNAQRMIGAGMGAYQNAQDVALRQSAINALMQSGLWGNLMGYGQGMGQTPGMNMGQGVGMGGTQFNPQTGQYEYPDGTPAFYGPGAPGDLPITDPGSGIQFDPSTGQYFDPVSGTMVDPSMISMPSGGGSFLPITLGQGGISYTPITLRLPGMGRTSNVTDWLNQMNANQPWSENPPGGGDYTSLFGF